eukprot:141045-Chlamydomonas_euryale.AAC.1
MPRPSHAWPPSSMPRPSHAWPASSMPRPSHAWRPADVEPSVERLLRGSSSTIFGSDKPFGRPGRCIFPSCPWAPAASLRPSQPATIQPMADQPATIERVTGWPAAIQLVIDSLATIQHVTGCPAIIQRHTKRPME